MRILKIFRELLGTKEEKKGSEGEGSVEGVVKYIFKVWIFG